MVNQEELRILLKRVNLHNVSKIKSFDVGVADPLEYLYYIVNYEITKRNENTLAENRKRSKLPNIKKIYEYLKTSDVIIVDEMLYVNLPEEDLSLLYKGLMFLNESRILICIINRALSDWKNASRDKHTMQTLIDRIFKDAKLLYLN